jgi:hypothetical protein
MRQQVELLETARQQGKAKLDRFLGESMEPQNKKLIEVTWSLTAIIPKRLLEYPWQYAAKQP